MKTGKLLCALFAVLFCFSACTSVPAGDPKLNKLIAVSYTHLQYPVLETCVGVRCPCGGIIVAGIPL